MENLILMVVHVCAILLCSCVLYIYWQQLMTHYQWASMNKIKGLYSSSVLKCARRSRTQNDKKISAHLNLLGKGTEWDRKCGGGGGPKTAN